MSNLNLSYDIDERYKAFEEHEEGLLISLAGPGTGKTTSLVKRIKSLINQGFAITSICYLTFIKEIANSFLIDYLEEFDGTEYEINQPRISTLHSFACSLLRNKGFQLGFDGELSFFSASEIKEDHVKTIYKDLIPLLGASLNTNKKISKFLKTVKDNWRNLKCFDQSEVDENRHLGICLDLFKSYRLIDWDQSITLGLEIIRRQPDLPNWIKRIDHFLIDEFQDFNKSEQEFIEKISNNAKSIVIVGDDNQSLYSSRGGSPDKLLDLFNSPEHIQVSLEKCFRCKSTIIDKSNIFLSKMNSSAKPLIAKNEGGEIKCVKFSQDYKEIDYLEEFLSNELQKLPPDPQQKDGIVCLFPSWRLLDYYFEKLSVKIPCIKRKPSDNKERKKLKIYLEYIHNPERRFIERQILEYFSNIKPRHKKLMVQEILQQDISPKESFQILLEAYKINRSSFQYVQEYCDFCGALGSRDSAVIAPVLASIFKKDTQFIEQKLLELINYPDDLEIDDYIEKICDEIMPESASDKEDPKKVLFLTMHGAKGLTRRTVILPGLENAWMPGNTQGIDPQEKKRQFYVSITRAKDSVLITYPVHRTRGEKLCLNVNGRGIGCSYIMDSEIEVIYIR